MYSVVQQGSRDDDTTADLLFKGASGKGSGEAVVYYLFWIVRAVLPDQRQPFLFKECFQYEVL